MQWLTMKIRRMIILTTLAAVATISENCDGIKTVVEQNKHDWEKILVYPQPGILNYHPQIQEKIDGFFESLNRGNKTHLVVLMERSAKLGKSEFYLRQRKLVEDILRFHTDMRPDHLISSIITFSFKDSDTHFDVTGSDKDMFFRDIWPNVIYEPDKAIGDVDMRFAFTAARDRFEKFGNQNSVTRLLLLLASGEFTDSPDRITREDLQSKKVSIYVVQCGEESDEGRERLRALASKPEMYGTFFQWMNASWVYRPPGIVALNLDCEPHGRGYMAGSDTFPACRCLWGYKGDHCKEDENECVFDLCGTNGECFHGTGTFTCSCLDSICGCYCDETCATNELCAPWWVTFLVTLVFLIPFALNIVIYLVLRHERGMQNPGEPVRYTVRWFMQRFAEMVSTRCRCNGTPESSHNQYYPRDLDAVYHDPEVSRQANRAFINDTQLTNRPGVAAVRGLVTRAPDDAPHSMAVGGAVGGQVRGNFQHVAASTGFDEPAHIAEERPALNRRAARRLHAAPLPAVPNREEVDGGYEVSRHDSNIPPPVRNISYGIEPEATLGMHPPTHLPYLEDEDEEEEDIPNCEESIYQNMLTCRDMEPWRQYLLKVLFSGRLDSVCIMNRDVVQFIASDDSFSRSTREAFDELDRNISGASAGKRILFESSRYIMSAETRMGHYFSAVDNTKSVVLCVARNDHFLVVGKRAQVSDRSKMICLQNVTFMCDRLVSRSSR